MCFLFCKSLDDKCNQAVLITWNIHYIKVFPQKLSRLFHFAERNHLPFGNTGSSNLTLFTQHIRQFRIIRLNGRSGILNRNFLLINQSCGNRSNINLTPTIRNCLITALDICHRSRQIFSILHFQIFFHFCSRITIWLCTCQHLLISQKNFQNIRICLRILCNQI